MKRYYCAYGGAGYDRTIERIVRNAPLLGADEVYVFDDLWMETTEFRQTNRWAWDHPGHNGVKYGGGWYCWKPFVIREMMKHLAPGDILLYTDADTYPIADFSCLYSYCDREGFYDMRSMEKLIPHEKGFFLFEATGCKDRQWVKRDVWQAVWPSCNPVGALDSQHATARFMLFQKGVPAVHRFLADWERLCCVPGLTTRDPSAELEYEGFEENRGDQSIFSLLTHKYNLPLHREADGFGEASMLDRDLYGQLFRQEYCQGDRTDLSGSKFRRIP